jgi:hypothetical protein
MVSLGLCARPAPANKRTLMEDVRQFESTYAMQEASPDIASEAS